MNQALSFTTSIIILNLTCRMDQKKISDDSITNKKGSMHTSRCDTHKFPDQIPDPEIETIISPIPATTPVSARPLARASTRKSS